MAGVTFYGAKKRKKYKAPDADFAQDMKAKDAPKEPTAQIREAISYTKPPAKRN